MRVVKSVALQRSLGAGALFVLLAATATPAGILKVEVGVEGMF